MTAKLSCELPIASLRFDIDPMKAKVVFSIGIAGRSQHPLRDYIAPEP